MLEFVVAIPVLILAFVLQTTILVRISLLDGIADLVMLVVIAWALQDKTENAWMWAIIGGLIVGFGSAVPWFIFPICYLGIVWFSHRFRSRIWQSSILAMMIITIAGTFTLLTVEFFILRLTGINLNFKESLTRIILPSMLLNLLFAFPVFWGMRELSNLIYRNRIES